MGNEKLTELKSGIVAALGAVSMTAEEREIATLIDAALQQEILAKAERYGSTPYFEFTLRASEKKFTVCFGCDPDRAQYPRAERALRASRFVDGLLNIVNTAYNCYAAVPQQIKPPARTNVRDRIFGSDSDIVLGEGKAQSRDAQDAVKYRTAYELEMVVVVAFGNKYERINECVTVELDAQDNATYTYGSITQKTISRNMPLSEAQKADSIRDANHIRAKVQSEGEKKKILEALALEDSRFRRFMDSLADSDSKFIGQVDIYPCFVFVDAIPERTFLYDVTEGGQTAKELLRITWNKAPRKFSGAPLYIHTAKSGEEIRFDGLTHDSRGGTLDGKELPTFDPADRLILVYGYDARSRSMVPGGLSLLPDDLDQPSYKGMTDWGVPVDGVSADLVGANGVKEAQGYRYYRSETVVVEGKRYLKEDVGTCAYTGKPTWKGALTAFDVDFLNEKGEFVKGRIDRSLVHDKNKRACEYCRKDFTFFAEDDRYAVYRKSKKYLLWDGTCKCPKCKEGSVITEGSRTKRKLIKALDPMEAETRQVYALWDVDKDAPVPIYPDGNVYRCAHSGKYIYYGNDKPGVKQYEACPTCGQTLSVKSYKELEKANMRQINGKLYCGACLKGRGRKLYEDVYLPNGQKGVLVDLIKDPVSLVTCECGKLLYKQAPGFPECECEGCTGEVYLCTTCWSKRPRSKFLHDKRLCDACAAYERNHAGLLKEEQEREAKAREEAVAIRGRRQEEERHYKTVADDWVQTVWEEMDKYLPHLSFADALYVRRAHKKWKAEQRAAQDSVKQAEAKLEELTRKLEKAEYVDGGSNGTRSGRRATLSDILLLRSSIENARSELDKAHLGVARAKATPRGIITVVVNAADILEIAGKNGAKDEMYLSFKLRVDRKKGREREYEFLYENGKVTYVEVKS